jgi:hypothetical protein
MSAFDISNRDPRFKTEQYFSRGWEIFKSHAFLFIAFTILTILIFGALSFFLPYPIGAGIPENREYGGNIIINVLSPLFGAGYYTAALKIARGRSINFSEFFEGFQHVIPLLLLSFVGGIIVLAGLFLALLPGIYFSIAFILGFPILLDRNLDFWNALKSSVQIVSRKWFSFFGLTVALLILNLWGLLLLGMGLLATIPWSVCIVVAAYEDLVGLRNVPIISDSEGIT